MQTTPHPEGQIDCTVHGAVLQIGINRPAKRNGFTPKMFRELGEAYTRLDDDPAPRTTPPRAARRATISPPGWICRPSRP
jgi:hypothetical protein